MLDKGPLGFVRASIGREVPSTRKDSSLIEKTGLLDERENSKHPLIGPKPRKGN